MNNHNTIRSMLPLAAAGVLAPEERSTVEEHAATCSDCRRELEILRVYLGGLRDLPQPAMPVNLLQRTTARLVQERATATDRRWHGLTLGLLVLFSWTSGTMFWMLAWKILGLNLAHVVTWSIVSSLLVWTTAGAAAVILGRRNGFGRRVI